MPDVRVVDVPARPTVVVRAVTTWAEFPTLWRRLLDEVYAALPDGKGGLNVMLYRDDVPHVEVGVLAAEPFTATGRVVVSGLPAGEAAQAVHRGRYAELDATHRAIHDWYAVAGRRLAGPRWEIYGHWREDPAELETEVAYLLA